MTTIKTSRSGITPKDSIVPDKTEVPVKSRLPEPSITELADRIKKNFIEGLAPIENETSQVLILGTMPSVESLKRQAYYGHPRNLFWKLIAEITGETVPEDYEDKKKYLLKYKIALWDMCQTCIRAGSLDSNISEEMPNDIKSFITGHPHIKAIVLNGKESERLYRKYITGMEQIHLISMPSTSPANTGVLWEKKVEAWSRLKEFV